MALIKCTECGAMISDQAKSCPKCGCPVEHDDQVEEIHNRPRRIGKWILVAVIAIIAIGGGIAYITLSKDNIIKQATHEEPMVKLTPEFCKAVRKYNCLFDFENGFASVRNGEKWEPSIQKEKKLFLVSMIWYVYFMTTWLLYVKTTNGDM